MITAEDYEEVINHLTSRFKGEYTNSYGGDHSSETRMVGIVFASPNSPLAKSEIIAQLADWHYRSGNHIDFLFAGYSSISSGLHSEVEIAGPEQWFYDPRKFASIKIQIEDRTKWKFGGECELLLTNARFNRETNRAELDFTSTICCQLNKMKEDRAISSVASFFESVFRYAESATGDDPTWGISDRLGLNVGRSTLKRLILELLPRGLGADYRRAEHFAVRNVGI